jgi:hypothetical protein
MAKRILHQDTAREPRGRKLKMKNALPKNTFSMKHLSRRSTRLPMVNTGKKKWVPTFHDELLD